MINSEMQIEKLEVWNGPSRPLYFEAGIKDCETRANFSHAPLGDKPLPFSGVYGYRINVWCLSLSYQRIGSFLESRTVRKAVLSRLMLVMLGGDHNIIFLPPTVPPY